MTTAIVIKTAKSWNRIIRIFTQKILDTTFLFFFVSRVIVNRYEVNARLRQ